MPTMYQHSEVKQESIEDLVSHILEEARMVLPGITALLGFQLVAVYNQTFADMPQLHQILHVAAIFLSINAICFLLTPAAIHRQANPEEVTREFARTASRFICLGMAPLLFSIVLDAYVVFHHVLKDTVVSLILACLLLLELSYFWMVLPQKSRRVNTVVFTPEC